MGERVLALESGCVLLHHAGNKGEDEQNT